MKNVIMLSLSTFNPNKDGELEPCRLKYKEKDLEQYYYQLEPILNLYRHLNKGVDAVIYLYTQRTMDKRTVIINGQKRTVSEKEYFEELVKAKFGDTTELKPIEVSQETETVKDVINGIRELNHSESNQNDKLSLTIDIHGGFRDTQMIIQSIITLLRFESIIPKEIYTVTFDDSNRVGYIKPADETYDINNYVSAMSEFLTYGRSQSLERYYSNHPDKELVRIIKSISDSIQLCHIKGFDDAIKDMKNYVDTYKESGSYNDIFIKSIEASYGELMSKKGRTKVINKVKWCVDHDFVQQALTIIESQMPSELRQRQVIDYKYDKDENEQTVRLYQEDDLGNLREIEGGISLSKALSYRKPEWESEINFSMIPWIRENYCDKKTDPNGYSRYENRITISGVDKNSYLQMPIKNWQMQKSCRIKPVNMNRNLIELGFKISQKLTRDGKENFARLLTLHLALKDCRNESNHAVSRKRPGVDEVKQAIYAYIDLTNLILDEMKSKKTERDLNVKDKEVGGKNYVR